MKRIILVTVVLSIVSGLSCQPTEDAGKVPRALSDEEFARPEDGIDP